MYLISCQSSFFFVKSVEYSKEWTFALTVYAALYYFDLLSTLCCRFLKTAKRFATTTQLGYNTRVTIRALYNLFQKAGNIHLLHTKKIFNVYQCKNKYFSMYFVINRQHTTFFLLSVHDLIYMVRSKTNYVLVKWYLWRAKGQKLSLILIHNYMYMNVCSSSETWRSLSKLWFNTIM